MTECISMDLPKTSFAKKRERTRQQAAEMKEMQKFLLIKVQGDFILKFIIAASVGFLMQQDANN